MSHDETSERARALFDTAKLDGPSDGTRKAMWAGINGATVGASSLAAAKGGAIASSKLALGIALGATLTVGIAATVIAITRGQASPRGSERVTAFTARTLEHVTPQTKAEDEAPAPVVITGRVAAPVEIDTQQAQAQVAEVPTQTRTGSAPPPPVALSEHDRLAREARLVSEARGALHRGDPESALRVVRAARKQAGARMVPEELTVEAQALRAMGDEAGAKQAEAELAGKFPEQAIAH